MTDSERELSVAPHPIGHHATCASVGNPDLIACDCEFDDGIAKAYANGMDKAERQIVEWLRTMRSPSDFGRPQPCYFAEQYAQRIENGEPWM